MYTHTHKYIYINNISKFSARKRGYGINNCYHGNYFNE